MTRTAFIRVMPGILLLAVVGVLAGFRLDGERSRDQMQAGQCRAGLRIVSPVDSAVVPQTLFVQGTAGPPNSEVWTIIHPMALPDRWVQQVAVVNENCRWRVQVHIGEPGQAHVGQHFEIRAVVQPRARLHEGQVLQGWPSARWQSQIVEVIRG